MELRDRLNWQQACTLLGCSKSMLYKLVDAGDIKAHGVGARFRWFDRTECVTYLEKKSCQE